MAARVPERNLEDGVVERTAHIMDSVAQDESCFMEHFFEIRRLRHVEDVLVALCVISKTDRSPVSPVFRHPPHERFERVSVFFRPLNLCPAPAPVRSIDHRSPAPRNYHLSVGTEALPHALTVLWLFSRIEKLAAALICASTSS